MSRQPEIEAIFEALWDLEHGAPHERAKAETRLNKLLDSVIDRSGGTVNRYQIQSALHDRYKAFRAEKRRQEKIQVAQSTMRQS